MSEQEILDLIHQYFPNDDNKHILARGDDCAVIDISANSHLVITTDIFAEDVHFRSSYFSPKSIGYKALAVNISDIYSMGAKPFSAQLALSLPKNYEQNKVEELLQSMADLAKEHDILLSGGDLSSSDKLCLSITLLGLKEKEVKLYRNMGGVDDIVYIVGEIGLSRLALHLLEEEKISKEELEKKFPNAYKAHFFLELHKETALQIADFQKKHTDYTFSLMDLSDGLARDLPRLVQDYGLELLPEYIPIHQEIMSYFNNKEKALEFIIQGGEDYALLGTCPKDLWNEFLLACPKVRQIGIIKEEQGIFVNNTKLELQGFDHFAKQ